MSGHNYEMESGCQICRKCGTAKHNKLYADFMYWLEGVGYDVEPDCISVLWPVKKDKKEG